MMKACILVMLLLGFTDINANAGWNAPEEYLVGEWSDSINGFGLIESESSFEFPTKYCTTTDGNFVISDSVNNRIKMYKKGVLTKIIKSPENDADIRWPDVLMCAGNTIVTDDNKTKRVYDTDGGLISLPIDKNYIYAVNDRYIATAKKNEYMLYDSSWNLIKKSVVAPKEIGYSDGNTVYINDKTICISNDNIYMYKVDDNYNIFITDLMTVTNSLHYEIAKYNNCGQAIARLVLPSDDVTIDDNESVTRNMVVSNPYIASNGDIYAAIASDDEFKILIWKWTDSQVPAFTPVAPTNISVRLVNDFVRIVWENASQDPGCVSGYELLRSDAPNGTFIKLATIPTPKVDLKYIYDDRTVVEGKRYYYKIRTITDEMFSDYSATISEIVNIQ